MRPYYEQSGVTIYHGDCRDFLSPETCDGCHVVTDPPYNIGFAAYRTYSDNLIESEYVELLAELRHADSATVIQYPEESMRFVLPALGIPDHVGAWCYNSNIPRRFRLINYYGAVPDYSRVKRPYKNANDKRVRALIDAGSEGTALYEWWDDIQLVKNVSAEKTIHPCPVPLQLIQRIITVAVNPQSVVVDPFAGSGTTLVAAKQLGRRAVGIEMDEHYCEVAAQRLEQEVLDFGGAA